MNRRELTLLLGLADGSLPEERRAEAEAWLASRPDGRQLLARQRAAVQALRAGGPATPPMLERRVTSDVRGAREPRRRTAFLRPAAVAGATLALIVAVLAIGLSVLPNQAPSVLAVANLGRSGPVAPPPPAERQRPELLDRELSGVAFPNWGRDMGWVPSGARTDRLEGRETSTVFYTHQGHRIAYTVVEGDALDPPAGARRMVVHGLEHYMLRLPDGREALMFDRNGKTCVIAGHVISLDTIHRLAAWDGHGRLRF